MGRIGICCPGKRVRGSQCTAPRTGRADDGVQEDMATRIAYNVHVDVTHTAAKSIVSHDPHGHSEYRITSS